MANFGAYQKLEQQATEFILGLYFSMPSVLLHIVVFWAYFNILHGDLVAFINDISIEAIFICLLTGISTMKTRSRVDHLHKRIKKLNGR